MSRRVHRVVFVDFKNHLFRADLGFFALHIQPRAPRLWRLEFAKLTKARVYSAQRSFRARRAARAPLHFDRRLDVYTRARAVPVCQYYRTSTRTQNLACARAHMQDHVEAARRHRKAFDIFCMRRNRGSVVLLPTTILALETARGLGR